MDNCAPFLRWAGSKRRLVPILRTYWTKNHKRYLEPFAGSACLFFALNPRKAILGDLNAELIATYLEVKYRLPAVLRALHRLPASSRANYNRLRSAQTKRVAPATRAARFIYLNRFCFNGIYRTNLAGQFNVPYSGERCGIIPPDNVFASCSKRMQVARLVKGDFEKVLRHARKGDLVYMDPPFAVRGRRVFRQYDPSTFTFDDIKRLRKWLLKLDAAKVNFIVSYAESDEADILRKHFGYETVSVRRNIAGFASHRALTNELLISNI
jgi:DNA adenine methylase